ncbi:F-box/FBD/LRR-repeat protein-like protein [Tanacetum coccineum]|uniref:F-box/FBD/LRR-repeat protein-like protein n=1 Tax=Tanacetum coccineum TaxID=301880 RepID=A0ABQ5H5V9_9ASTR
MELAHGSRKVPKFAPEDIISSMPEEVISNILGRLPLQDAVRTSILSSCGSRSGLCSTNCFDVKRNNKVCPYMPFDSIVDFQDVNNWVEYLSRKGIKEFTLKNMNETPLELPSHLFSCRELKHLKLYNCYVCPKSGFQGFQSLLCLDLSEVVFEGYTCGELISRCPSLEILKLRSNTGGKIKRVELAKLGNLKLSADAEMNILTALPYLKTLRLYEIDFSNEIMVSCVIDLLRGFSHLETLLIKSLLACSPLLKKMVISPKSSEMFGGDDGERKFVAELMLHRASPVAKIVFESSYDATTSHD